MAKIANAIRARGEPVELIGRPVSALVTQTTDEFDTGRGRALQRTFHLRIAKVDAPCDNQGNSLVKAGAQIIARGKTLRAVLVDERTEDLAITAE